MNKLNVREVNINLANIRIVDINSRLCYDGSISPDNGPMILACPPTSSDVGREHRRLVLDSIWESPGGTTRAQIARHLHFSRSAISEIVDNLVQCGLVREQEERASRAGRRPIGLEIDPSRGQVLGIDVGATHLLIVLADLASRPLAEIRIPFDVKAGPDAALREIRGLAGDVLREAGSEWGRVLAIGVGVPGPVVSQEGMVVAPPIMPGWHQFPIRLRLEELFHQPVIVHNDANLGALGEWTFGAGRRRPNLVFMKVGTGIGLGMILNGQLHEGELGAAGEIGHMTLVENGPLCACGSRGCLEALAGGGAIAAWAREAVAAGTRTHLASMGPAVDLTALDVAEAAAQGDHLAQQILAQAGQHIGVAIAAVVNLLNPGIVVIGGGVAQAGDLLLEPIRTAIRSHSLQAGASSLQVTSASLGYRSSAMGAVAAALSLCFDRLLAEAPTQHARSTRRQRREVVEASMTVS